MRSMAPTRFIRPYRVLDSIGSVGVCCVCNLPLNFVAIGPSHDSCIRSNTELMLVTSMPIRYGGSGGFVWSQPKSMRRSPLMRRSHMPICFSASVPVHPDTDGPVYALPVNKTITCLDEIQLKYHLRPLLLVNTSKIGLWSMNEN